MRWNPTKEEHYYSILKPLEPWIPKQQLQSWVDATAKRFRRRDRIQYVLMMIRMKAVLKLLASVRPQTGTTIPDYFTFKPPASAKEVKKLQALYWKFMDNYTDPTQALFDTEIFPVVMPARFPHRLSPEVEDELWNMLQHQAETLEHLMDTMQTGYYQTALKLTWIDQSINTPLREDSQLVKQLEEAIDQDRANLQDEFILLEDVERLAGPLLVDCGNGFSWRVLETHDQQRVEAQLMDHCATSHQGVLLSLRELDPERGMRPHLTFEYIPDQREDLAKSVGTLREMKGRGNHKPAEKYHPQIICLLLKQNIIGVIGGGYREENNFSLDDLSPQMKSYLQTHRPDLFNPDLLIARRLPEVTSWIKKRIPSGYADKVEIKEVDGKVGVVGPPFESIYDAFNFVADSGLLRACDDYETVRREKVHDVFKNLAEILESPGSLNYSSGRRGSETLWDLVFAMGDTSEAKFRNLLSQLAKKHGWLHPQELVDTFYAKDWDELPDDLMQTLINAAWMAEEVGNEVGTIDAIQKELKEILPIHTSSGIVTKEGFINNAKTLLERGTHGEENSQIEWEECRRIAKVLWRAVDAQDYDKDAAEEYFFDRLNEEVP